MAWAADATFQFKNFKVIAVGRDAGLADKAGGFVDGETRGLGVSLKIGTGFQGAPLTCEELVRETSPSMTNSPPHITSPESRRQVCRVRRRI